MFKLIKQTTVLFASGAVMLGTFPKIVLAATFNLEEATVADVNAAFDAGALTSEQLTQLYLNRIDAYDNNSPRINSFLTINPNALETAAALDQERQLTGPRSSLHGVPVLLKDNIDTFDLPTTAGSLALEGSIPPNDAFITQQLRDAGAVILGKANLTEYANFLANGMPAGYSSLGGYVFNPYNPVSLAGGDGRPVLSPGGSSAGSAAAVAANLTTVSIGTETSGSILSPGNQNSVVGIKPTVGLVSRDGIIPIAASQDTAGPFGRTVADAATLLGAITGIDPSDPATSSSEGKFFTDYTQFLNLDGLKGARIGVPKDFYWNNLTGEQTAILEEAITVMESRGAAIVYEDIPTAQELSNVDSSVLYYEFKRDLNAYLSSLGTNAPVQTLADVIAFNEANPEAALKYGQARALRAETTTDEAQYLEDRATDLRLAKEEGLDFLLNQYDLDAVLFPSTSGAAVGAKAGYPSIIIPSGYQSNGAPYGVTLLGTAYSEPTLISLAYSYEQASMLRLPPTSTPPLPGEMFEYEPVPEPSAIIGISVFGLTAIGSRLRSQRQICRN